jgi:hypothetical protein
MISVAAKCLGAYLSRQIEGENGEIENADAGDDEVDHEEERLPPDLQVEVNIWNWKKKSKFLGKNFKIMAVTQMLSVSTDLTFFWAEWKAKGLGAVGWLWWIGNYALRWWKL